MDISEKHHSLFQKNNAFFGLMAGGFNNKAWRKLLSMTCFELQNQYPNITAISPFGFELLEDKTFLQGALRRFYIYIAAESHRLELSEKFSKIFFEKLLVIDPLFFDDIVVLIKNDNLVKLKETNYCCTSTDKLIDIQARNTKLDILTEYANYIITSLMSIEQNKGEVAEYQVSKKFRWRLYQLYLMHEKLFSDLIEPLTAQQLSCYKLITRLVSNRIDIFYHDDGKENLDDVEKNLIENLVKPRIKAIINAIAPKKGEGKVSLECAAFHYNDTLELTLSKFHYQLAVNKIKTTYLRYL
jgi:hypothetical protein